MSPKSKSPRPSSVSAQPVARGACSVGTCLAIIPARGGSKGLLRKNLRPVAGKPLIAWTIEAALQCPMLDRVVVSTEDAEIAAVARRCGAEVPFQRPQELAQDETPGTEPSLHAVRWLQEHEHYRPDFTVTLQPTSPLRTSEDIGSALRLAAERSAESVVSVCLAPHHPYWMQRLDAEGWMSDFLPGEGSSMRRQELPPLYLLNGALYGTKRSVLLARRSFYAERTCAYVMPVERSLDVDSAWDLHVAGLILQERRS